MTMTSRDIHDVRHISTARQARILCPKCKKDAAKPASSSATPRPTARSTRLPSVATPAICASANATNRPCAAPAKVVKNKIEKAGCMAAYSDAAGLACAVIRRGK